MKLSIIILNYNVRYFLELCLKSVQSALTNLDAEIIVVDNHSDDASCHIVKTLFPEVILIENKQNFGFSKGNNIGVAQAKGEYVCILNPDTVVAEDTFTKLLDFAETKENIGIVGCKLINGSGRFLPESKRNIPHVNISLKKMLGCPKDYYASHLDHNAIDKVSVLVGAFMMLKRSVYNRVGGFDEDYFMYGEDIDLSYKVLNAGYQNFYYGKTTVIHFKGESTLKDKHYARRFFGAMQLFYKKHLKTNMVYDAVVWFGIKFFYMVRKTPKIHKKQIDYYVLVSDKMNIDLEHALKKPIILHQKLNENDTHFETILDAHHLSYKAIITTIESNFKDNKLFTYKILPQHSNFILGSDSGYVKGKIIEF